MTLTPLPFTNETIDALPGSAGLAERRHTAAAALAETSWPTTEAEEWRYSPIGKLDVAAYPPVATPGPVAPLDLADAVEASARVAIVDGFVVHTDASDPVAIADATATQLGELPVAAFSLLAAALAPQPTVVSVAAGAIVAHPVVISNLVTTAGSSFPHVIVEADSDSEVTVVVVHQSADVTALCVPRIEVRAGSAARVTLVELQDFTREVTCLGRISATVGNQGTFTGWTAGLGGGFARHRLDCTLAGRGSAITYNGAYFGSGVQARDYRVFVDHVGRDTTSNLRFSGAVDDHSLAVYTGMIRIHPDARGSNATQTNRNITLSPDAWAESVPNLEIENNDVQCSHASTVGPVDEDQLFYLASRGVPDDVATQLIVAGFFDDIISASPVAPLADAARRDIRRRLSMGEPS
jgi:Fe-S cluster assembly protein SufD